MCCERIYSTWKLQTYELCSIAESLYWLLTNGIHSSSHFTSRKFPVDTYSARVLYLKLVLQLWIYICRSKQHNAVQDYLKKRNLQSLEQQDFTQYYPFCMSENSNGAKVPNYKVRELLRKSFVLFLCTYFIQKIKCSIDKMKIQTEISVQNSTSIIGFLSCRWGTWWQFRKENFLKNKMTNNLGI